MLQHEARSLAMRHLYGKIFNHLVFIPENWVQGRFYGLTISSETPPPNSTMGQLFSVNWMNKKAASLENLDKAWIWIPSHVSFARVRSISCSDTVVGEYSVCFVGLQTRTKRSIHWGVGEGEMPRCYVLLETWFGKNNNNTIMVGQWLVWRLATSY